MPKLLCICGPNGAGKSTFSRTIAMRENLLVIDPDKLAAEGLSPIAAGKAAARMAHLFLEEGVSFARESTLTAKFDFTLMEEAKQRGYEVELVYIRLASEELALKRVAARASRGGHSVPHQDVVRRFKRSLENLPKAMTLADKVTILDNSFCNYRKIS
ncbi:zeta toxin family protein [uncultured Desulfovibrio sp.]|uniref:zeta toxin family protein n=1 Tax=uncultured Desulfovibrio sp. TaxID=167968 RepID=UPI0026061E50|nr:zeta toxin family protein [uncultured Desulfovibrio sp.]